MQLFFAVKCNKNIGMYLIDKNSLYVNKVFSLLMFCQDFRHEQNVAYEERLDVYVDIHSTSSFSYKHHCNNFLMSYYINHDTNK